LLLTNFGVKILFKMSTAAMLTHAHGTRGRDDAAADNGCCTTTFT